MYAKNKRSKKTVLLAEDDPLLIDIYSTKLKNAGFKVEIARDGNECLAKLHEKKSDVLLLDIVLPQISGWEVLRQIKRDEKLKDLKIIILSNLGQRNEVKKGLELGAVRYLIKSHYTPSQVVEEIKKILTPLSLQERRPTVKEHQDVEKLGIL